MPNIAYDEKVEEFLAQLQSKKEELSAQIARYDREIEALDKAIEALTTLSKQTSGKNPVSARELDDLILDIFKRHPTEKIARRPLLKKLVESGADLSGFNNRMAYVHASVNRLYKRGILRREWADIADSTKKKLLYFLSKKESES